MERLKVLFEGREAIYIEARALRVKVTNIHGNIAQRYVSAEVEEVPTTGLPVGALYESKQHSVGPFCWSIGGGYLTAFSDNTWKADYGGWSLFFAPKILDAVLSLARQFPDNLDMHERYHEVLQYLQAHDA